MKQHQMVIVLSVVFTLFAALLITELAFAKNYTNYSDYRDALIQYELCGNSEFSGDSCVKPTFQSCTNSQFSGGINCNEPKITNACAVIDMDNRNMYIDNIQVIQGGEFKFMKLNWDAYGIYLIDYQ